jgi:hypothetical protein
LRLAKPTAENKEGRNLRRERRRWDDPEIHNLPLGCLDCADRELCAGIHKKQLDYYCLGDCCGDPSTCDNVCPRNFDAYVNRYREVNGFELANIPRATPRFPPDLPLYIPLIFHRHRRTALLDVSVVALPLHKFYSRRDHSLRYKTRAEIEAAFNVNRKARIIVIGCGRDKPIEAWWKLSAQRRALLQALIDLGIELVTASNYSLFTDVPRHDNLYNIKRIGIAWYEAVDSGMPCALHLNARTPRDYERLTQFIGQRAEVTDVAFEFNTEGAWPGRRAFHHRHLAQLAREVQKPLRMTMVGGLPAIPILAPAYAKLTFIDTTAFMKAMHRQRLVAGNEGNVLGIADPTERGEPVDDFLAHNIAIMRDYVERLVNASRQITQAGGSAPRQGIPESAPSAPEPPVSSRAAR